MENKKFFVNVFSADKTDSFYDIIIGWLTIEAHDISEAKAKAKEILSLPRNEMEKIVHFNNLYYSANHKPDRLRMLITHDGKRYWVRTKAERVDEKDNRPVTERIKTFEDCLKELGSTNLLVCEYNTIVDKVQISSDILAYLKLRIVTAALNERWEPTFEYNEWRYWPYFRLYTKEQAERLSDDDKKELLVVGGIADYLALCGLSSARSNGGFPHSLSNVGARLAFKSQELALYAGRQFLDIFIPFVYIVKE